MRTITITLFFLSTIFCAWGTENFANAVLLNKKIGYRVIEGKLFFSNTNPNSRKKLSGFVYIFSLSDTGAEVVNQLDLKNLIYDKTIDGDNTFAGPYDFLKNVSNFALVHFKKNLIYENRSRKLLGPFVAKKLFGENKDYKGAAEYINDCFVWDSEKLSQRKLKKKFPSWYSNMESLLKAIPKDKVSDGRKDTLLIPLMPTMPTMPTMRTIQLPERPISWGCIPQENYDSCSYKDYGPPLEPAVKRNNLCH